MNPFVLTSYRSPEFFCDREQEIKKLQNAIDNNRNITLISQRRMGKTGLIKHVEYLRQSENEIFIYLDILSTESFSDFVNIFGKTIYHAIEPKKNTVVAGFIKAIKSLRPVLSMDPINQMPTLSFNVQSQDYLISGFEQICTYLSRIDERIIIAIDEFQQIVNYPEKNIEALLRSQFQHLSNTSFIFSGSHKHLMLSIFTDKRNAFYKSSEFLELGRIPKETYIQFIEEKFVSHKRKISIEVILDAVDWCLNHTFYVQYFFNHLFGNTIKNVTNNDLTLTKSMLLEEHALIFDNYRKLLSKGQFKLLKAIANEGFVKQPNAGSFINNHNLGGVSSVNQAFNVLKTKDLIFEEPQGYRVGDVFFMHWLKK